MLVTQEGRCAICGTQDPGRNWPSFNVDHDHATGRVRGLLCANCNDAIGKLKDDPTLLHRAAEYLDPAGV